MRDVVDAGAEHECHRHRAGREQPEEVLCGQVRGERAAVRCPVRACAGQMTDRGAGRDELQAALAPGVHLHPQLHADDAVRTRWSASDRIRAIASSRALYIA